MKRILSLFISLIFVICSFCCVPAIAQGAVYTPDQKIYSESYMLINLDDSSYPVVAQQNQDVRRYPASLTKIVTAIVVINNVADLSQQTTVSQTAYDAMLGTGAQVANLKVGEVLTIEQLLYLTMVHSACDACHVLAEFVAGDVDSFCKMMNDWVISLGCKDTNFVNPDGLHDDNHYTTAQDMATITLEALKNETFTKIADTKTYEYNDTTFIHTNFMMDKFHVSYYYEYAKGIKTGSTSQAGYCVITRASKDGYNYLAVVMGAPIEFIDGYNRKCSFVDAKSLFEWAFNSLKYTPVIRQNDIVTELEVVNGKDADKVQLVAKSDVTTLVPASLDSSAVMIEPVDAPQVIEAPVQKGETICSANIIYGGQVIETVELVSAQTIELSTFLKVLNALKSFFTNPFVLIIVAILSIFAIVWVALFVVRIRKDKKQLEAKRRRRQELDDQINQDIRNNYRDDDYLPPPKR